MNPIIHFSHANGFPGGSYHTLFHYLSRDYDVRFTDRIGHHPDYPVTNNWPNLEQEMIHYFEQHYSAPVIAVGHSLGGVLSLRLARSRPDLVKAVVVLDVPVLSLFEAQGLKLLKRFKLMDKFTPAARMDGRRCLWPDEPSAVQYFRGKKLMRNFDERCLQDYVHYGTKPCENGIQLTFNPKVEQAIYRTIPDDFVLTKPLTVPVAAIAGKQSKVFNHKQAVRMQKKLNMPVAWLPGTHMFPFEYPEQTVHSITQLLAQILPKASHDV